MSAESKSKMINFATFSKKIIIPRESDASKTFAGIIYVAEATGSDIAYTVSYIKMFNNNPFKQHWNVIKRILCYVKVICARKIIVLKSYMVSVLQIGQRCYQI